MSHDICTSGWLGTTNDISVEALGEFEVVQVESNYLKDGREQIKIKSGGARQGTGPARRRFTLTHGSAVLLRELTRSQLKKKLVNEAEITTVLEALIAAAVDARLREIEPTE